MIFSERRASENKRERDANDRRRFALRQAQALAALTARGLSVAEAEAELAKGAPAPQESAPGGQVKAGAEVPGLARALETVASKGPELAGPDLKIYPGLAAAALARGCSRGLWLWNLARALDAKGEGRLLRAELAEGALKLGSSHKLKRALQQAQAAGLVQLVRRWRDGAEVVSYVCAEDAARSLGARSLGAAPVLVPAGKGGRAGVWKATLYGAYHAGRALESKPISRANIEQDTGLPDRTQRYYELRRMDGSPAQLRRRLLRLATRPAHMRARAEHCKRRPPVRSAGASGVFAQRNFSVEPVPDGDKHALRDTIAEHKLKGRSAFVVRGRFGTNLLVTLPNSYTAPQARLAKRGIVRKVNSSLRVASSPNAEGQHIKEPKLFHTEPKAARRAVKRYTRQLERPPLVCYARLRACQSGAVLWGAQ